MAGQETPDESHPPGRRELDELITARYPLDGIYVAERHRATDRPRDRGREAGDALP